MGFTGKWARKSWIALCKAVLSITCRLLVAYFPPPSEFGLLRIVALAGEQPSRSHRMCLPEVSATIHVLPISFPHDLQMSIRLRCFPLPYAVNVA